MQIIKIITINPDPNSSLLQKTLRFIYGTINYYDFFLNKGYKKSRISKVTHYLSSNVALILVVILVTKIT